jgi:hypothetical protein
MHNRFVGLLKRLPLVGQSRTMLDYRYCTASYGNGATHPTTHALAQGQANFRLNRRFSRSGPATNGTTTATRLSRK